MRLGPYILHVLKFYPSWRCERSFLCFAAVLDANCREQPNRIALRRSYAVHIMLVRQYRYDMFRQQGAFGGKITSNVMADSTARYVTGEFEGCASGAANEEPHKAVVSR
jgi:hypothetical protein